MLPRRIWLCFCQSFSLLNRAGLLTNWPSPRPHLVVTGAGWHHWWAHTPPQQGPHWGPFPALLLENVQGRLCLLPCLPPPASWGPLVVLRFESSDLVFKSALVQWELQVPELAVFVP